MVTYNRLQYNYNSTMYNYNSTMYNYSYSGHLNILQSTLY